MVYQDDQDNQLDADIAQLEEVRRSQRSYQRQQQARASSILSQTPQFAMPNVKALNDQIRKVLPNYMAPGNIGDIQKVSWPYFEVMTFDFGNNPLLSPATTQTQSFKVDQEAGFLILAVSWTYNSYNTGGALGPWLINFTDRQSSRQFMNAPIPVQSIGTRGQPLIFTTPQYVQPNAAIEGTMTTFVQGTGYNATGTSKHQFQFYGLRIRENDTENVLGTIFGG